MRINDHVNVHINYDKFSESCEEGSAMEVLAALKNSGFGRGVILERLEFNRGSIWHGTAPGWTPVESACFGDNPGVFRLFLELGLTPHSKCCANKKYPTFPDYVHVYQSSRVIAFLNTAISGWNDKSASVLPWWNYKYTPQKNSDLQATMEKQIMRGDLTRVLWIGLRGGRLERPDALASREFEIGSPLMRKLVWQLLVPENAQGDYQRWLQKSSLGTNGLAPHGKTGADAKEIFKNLLLSRKLVPTLDMLVGILTDDDRICLLKYLSEEVCPRGRNWKFAQELHPILCSELLLAGV